MRCGECKDKQTEDCGCSTCKFLGQMLVCRWCTRSKQPCQWEREEPTDGWHSWLLFNDVRPVWRWMGWRLLYV